MVRIWKTLLGAGAIALFAAGTAQADALPAPALSGPLAANPDPMSFESGYGKIYVTGAVSALGYYQSNAQHASPGDAQSYFDLSNAQVTIQKTDGLVQFFLEAGGYSLPTAGEPYLNFGKTTSNTFGALPVAYLKLAPTSNFSIEAGKLPTLIGAEYMFTFQNMNIERGLLWYQEPIVSRGVQANYTQGPLALSVSLNDGYYSNRYNWLSGLATYTIDSVNTLAFAAGGNLGATKYATFNSPYNLNNGEVFNLMYTYTSAPWLVNPYIQYQTVPASAKLGLTSGDEWGFGVLGTYSVSPEFSIAGRVEYELSSGTDALLPYGAKSKAYSLTLTPTYQKSIYFARADFSYTGLSDQSVGFGKAFNKDSQFRAMVEVGVVF